MPFQAGKSTDVLVDHFNLTSYFQSVTPGGDVDMLETTTFGKSAKTFIPGLKAGRVSAEGFWEPSAVLGSDVVLSSALGSAAQKAVTVAPAGMGIGSRVHMLLTDVSKYEMTSPVSGVAAIVTELTSSSGLEGGVALFDHKVLQAAAIASVGQTSVDNGAASTNGGVGHLHVPVNTGASMIEVKIQHSTDNSVWSDLITFTSVRVELAAGTTVNRYRRAFLTLSGTGLSVAIGVAFAAR